MPSILPILFILLGIFQAIFANQPGTVLFKFVNNKSRIDHVTMYQNGKEVKIDQAGEDGQAILLPTNEQAILLPTNLNKSKQFMVDWNKLPEMKEASDLKKISFRVSFGLGRPEVRDNFQMFWIGLRDRPEDLLQQLFDGGQAQILINNQDLHKSGIKYVETKQGDPCHLLFTVDLSQFSQQNVQFKSVQILQKYTTTFRRKEVEKPCESVKFSGEPITFLVDWKNCPKTINNSEMLRNIKIEFGI